MPGEFGLTGKGAKELFLALARTLPYSAFDFSCEVAANHLAVFLGFYFWEQSDVTTDGLDEAARDEVLQAMRMHWSRGGRSSIPLGLVERRYERP
ncbi:hypothetical protein AKJ09_04541 [Labilithrix luteola]|uniref:Uncharacterized protein n=1 Tax=Labilithrix luteola TaxID=1391654 RepID=A0A0K1PWI2_9BACT|nr:hypothetical protein [Labilithrix luteola]AKU97877.1 hypothetical protein AKJ09_04541 [Labilithrix luteola]